MNRQTANQRFKRRQATVLKTSLVAAVVVHVFAFVSVDVDLRAITERQVQLMPPVVPPVMPEPPPAVPVPPNPRAIPAPAFPRVSSVVISSRSGFELPILPNESGIRWGPPEYDVPPVTRQPFQYVAPHHEKRPTDLQLDAIEVFPPVHPNEDIRDEPRFVPFDTPPVLTNAEDIRAALAIERERAADAATFSGRLETWLFITDAGEVVETRIKTTSGRADIDEAGLRVVSQMRFRPAENRGVPLGVWVSQWVTFEVPRG